MFGKKRKRWDRDEYPENWEELAQAAKERAAYTCEFCGVEHRGEGTNRHGGPYEVRVAAAHKYPNDTHNPDPDLYCLCQSCHRTYDNRFKDIIEEGKHQAVMHEILLEREGYGKRDESGAMSMVPDEDRVWCEECQGWYWPHEH